MIEVSCSCGRTFGVPTEYAGRVVKCPVCGVGVAVPDPVPVPAVPAPLDAPQRRLDIERLILRGLLYIVLITSGLMVLDRMGRNLIVDNEHGFIWDIALRVMSWLGYVIALSGLVVSCRTPPAR